MRHRTRSCHTLPGQVTLEDVEAVIRKVDVDGDGQINYEEFTKVIIEERATRSEPVKGK